MRILEIGCGAVGLGLASALAAAGARPDLTARSRTASVLRATGLRRTGVLGDVYIPPEGFNVFRLVAAVPPQAYDLVLVCTKAYDAETVARELAASPWLVTPQTHIVLFFNGIGGAEIFAERFPKDSLYTAKVVTGFEKTGDGDVHVTVHAADLLIGNPFTGECSPVPPLCGLLTAGGIPARPSPDILAETWAKILYNCAVNAPGAIFRTTIGGLAADPHRRRLMESIIREVFAVMASAGFRTHWPDADAYLEVFYGRLIPLTASHETSMSQDLRCGKRTEIDFLNGAIVRLGHRFGIPVPANQSVTEAIRRIESTSPASYTKSPTYLPALDYAMLEGAEPRP